MNITVDRSGVYVEVRTDRGHLGYIGEYAPTPAHEGKRFYLTLSTRTSFEREWFHTEQEAINYAAVIARLEGEIK